MICKQKIPENMTFCIVFIKTKTCSKCQSNVFINCKNKLHLAIAYFPTNNGTNTVCLVNYTIYGVPQTMILVGKSLFACEGFILTFPLFQIDN